MTHGDSPVLPLTLSDYVSIVNRRKWVIVLALVVVSVLAFVLSIRQDKVFRAASEVLLTRQNISAVVTGINNPDIYSDPARFAETQAGLARAPAVARRAVARAGNGATFQGLLAESTVTPKSNADLLRFTVDGSDPDNVTALANAYAGAFTAYKRDLDTEQLAKARAELDGRLRSLRRSGQGDTSLYRALLQNAQQLRTMELLQTRNVVVPATGASQIAPTPTRNAILGAAFGLLLGLAFAFAWEALDKRVRTEDEMERRLGLPLLSRLPAPSRRVRDEPHLSMIDDPYDAHAEAVRKLRTNIEFANVDLQAKTIMVTSAVQREGKSTTMANLAVALARSGRSVALIDVDLRQPALAAFFGLENRFGLTDVVLGRRPLRSALKPIKLPASSPSEDGGASAAGRLDVLTSGPLPTTPGELVGSQELERVIAELRKTHDYVLLDAPPLLVVDDAMALSARADAILVVARLGIVDRRTLADLSRELEASPAPKLGFVVTGADVQTPYGYGYLPSAAQRAQSRSRPTPKRASQRTAPTPAASSAEAGPESGEDDEKSRRWAPRVVR